MAFPSNIGSTVSLADVLKNIRGEAGAIKLRSQNIRAASAAGPVSAPDIFVYMELLAKSKAKLSTLSTTPGLAEYAQTELGNASLDIAAEFSTMLAAVTAVQNWMITNFPKDSNGYLLASKFDANGIETPRQFSSAELATFRTQLDSLIATID